MAPRFPRLPKYLALSLIMIAAFALPARAQYGLWFSGTGPVNRAMAGVSVATATDATGGLYWNPATISGLERSELDFGVELLYPRSRLASSIPAGALGPAGPPITLAGSDGGDNGVFPLPSIGLAYRPEESSWTFGLGIFEVGGFGVNYPASNSNPILTPQPPIGVGLGSIYTQLQALEIAPSISYQLTDRLAIGFGPTANLNNLKLDPAVIAAPDAAAGGIFARYPSGTHNRFEWGVGVQAGITFALNNDWRLGGSLKSPRWFEKFGFNSADELGRPRHFTFDADLPLVASTGVSYTGFQRWLLEADVHCIDYANTQGFRQSGFDSSGALQGVGWKSIWALALGARYRLTDALALMMGYSFNDEPIDSAHASFNVGAPTIIENTLTMGATYWVTDSFNLSLAYAHAFQNSISGPIVTPAGAIPGSSVTSVVSADTVVLGGSVLFGCKGN